MSTWANKGDLGDAVSADTNSISCALDSASGQISRLGEAIPDSLQGEAYDADRRLVNNVCVPALKAQYVALQSMYDGDQSNSGGVSDLPDDPSPLDSDDLSGKIKELDNSIAALQVTQPQDSGSKPSLMETLQKDNGISSGSSGSSSQGSSALEDQISSLQGTRDRLAEALQALMDYDSASSSYYSDADGAIADALSQSCRQMASVRETGEVPSDYPSWGAGLDDLYEKAFANRVEDIESGIWDGESVNQDRLTELYDSESLTAEQRAALDRAYTDVGRRAMQGDTSQLEVFFSCGYAVASTSRTDPDQNGMCTEEVTYSLRPGARAMFDRWSKDEGIEDVTAQLSADGQINSTERDNLLSFLDGAAMACVLKGTYSMTYMAVSAKSSDGRSIGGGYSPDVTPRVIITLDTATTADGQTFHVLNMDFGGGAQLGDSFVAKSGGVEHVTFEGTGEQNAIHMASHLAQKYQKDQDPAREAIAEVVKKLIEGWTGCSLDVEPSTLLDGFDLGDLGHGQVKTVLDSLFAGGKKYLEVQEDNRAIATLGSAADVAVYAHLHFRHTGGVVAGDDGVAVLAGTATEEEQAERERALEDYGRTGGSPDGFMAWLNGTLPDGSTLYNGKGEEAPLPDLRKRYDAYSVGLTVEEPEG